MEYFLREQKEVSNNMEINLQSGKYFGKTTAQSINVHCSKWGLKLFFTKLKIKAAYICFYKTSLTLSVEVGS